MQTGCLLLINKNKHICKGYIVSLSDGGSKDQYSPHLGFNPFLQFVIVCALLKSCLVETAGILVGRAIFKWVPCAFVVENSFSISILSGTYPN